MRLWSLHPSYLDSRGLIALWREGLLAQAALLGITSGYANHPQLLRFKQELHPSAALSHYLQLVFEEAKARGFNFNLGKLLLEQRLIPKMMISDGQLAYELELLKKKLAVRAPEQAAVLAQLTSIAAHPSFNVLPGPIASWEKLPAQTDN